MMWHVKIPAYGPRQPQTCTPALKRCLHGSLYDALGGAIRAQLENL